MSQTATDGNSKTAVEPYKNDAFEGYITWRALGGLVIDEENEDVTNKVRQMSLEEFCKTYDVNRTTVYRWKIGTPDLAAKVNARRAEIIPMARVSAAWNQLFLLGMQSKDKRAAVDALKLFLGHYGDLKLPTQKTEVDASQNLMDLVNQARKKNITIPIEGEVVEPNSNA